MDASRAAGLSGIRAACFLFFCVKVFSMSPLSYIETVGGPGRFPLVAGEQSAVLYVETEEAFGVQRAVSDLQSDLERVTGRRPKRIGRPEEIERYPVVIGTLGTSRLLEQLVAEGKLDVSPISGQWESFLIETVSDAVDGMDALVLAGSDKRGTIYAIYDLSEQIGVSPWSWWADVPVRRQSHLYVRFGRYVQRPPAVPYRGIFLNNEAPALSHWVHQFFGGYNHAFYSRVFELILRLKGNFLWPAMWNNSFYTDDPLNGKTADDYGIVIGTSHHEPMMRAWKEWSREGHPKGSWDYSKNAEALEAYWAEGIRRSRPYEKVVTLGMRGDGDEPMSEEANIDLLERIVSAQRRILAQEVGPEWRRVPQVWALYKEVQGYYERGMRVPEDIVLLWCDDNWGNLRRLPTAQERRRSGGAGIYYHFDYVGGPRSYKWINTYPIAKIWEQMNLAYHFEANRLWIVNVGDLKPMEFPMEFFLTLAWDPSVWPKEKLATYCRLWAQRQFGAEYAEAAAQLLNGYSRFNGRRKPELLSPETYSLIHYGEAERVVAELGELTALAETIHRRLPADTRDAFFQLVLHPTKATSIVNELYITVARNHLYARQRRATTNETARKARALFEADAALSRFYENELAGGKWTHLMEQTHIGYTSWNQPAQNVMPDVKEIELEDAADMAIAVEGSTEAWPGCAEEPRLPEFSVFTQDKHYVDIFNRGRQPFSFTATASEPWIQISQEEGTVEQEVRLWVSIDWSRVPAGRTEGTVRICGTGKAIAVGICCFRPLAPTRETLDGFVESNGYVSIEAEHYTGKIDTPEARWEKIPEYGHTLSAMSIFPVTAGSVEPPKDSPCLEYKMYLFHPGTVRVHALVAPSLNFVPERGLRCGVSFDDQPPQILELVPKGYQAENGNRDWELSVMNNLRTLTSTHTLEGEGYHTLKFWMVDTGVVLQKLLVDTGGLKPSYLGPCESFFNRRRQKAEAGTSRGAFASGRYRNLFAECGYSQEQIQAKLQNAYRQLFFGDPESQAVYYPAGQNANGPLAYILDVQNQDVRSEGISYGMMIAVQMDRKAEFDALWNWAKTYMYQPDPRHPSYGYFAWSLKPDGTANDPLCAPDGEEYLAMALYFAAGRWGNGSGIYHYHNEAQRLLSDMLHRRPITGPTSRGVKTTFELFSPRHRMVRFTCDIEHSEHTDPSYHLPAFYELWALWGPPGDRSFWRQAAEASRDFFEKTAHPVTGLAPEYAHFDGRPWAAPWHPGSVHFQFDSWRTAMNWAIDWAWWGKDLRAVERSDRIQAFFASKGMDAYVGQYTLDGIALSQQRFDGLICTNAVVSLAASNPRAKEFVQALWNLPIPTGKYRYYDGLLYLMSLLHCSGEFRIWSEGLGSD